MLARTEPMEKGITKFSRAELLQASMELNHHTLSYVKSMALRCAVKLGVADAIHRRGGKASLDDLLVTLSLDAGRLPLLRRVMRVLAASGVFAQGDDGAYRLTAVSSLLVDGADRKSLAPMLLLYLSPSFVAPVVNLAEWVGSDAETAFEMMHGADIWSVLSRDAEFSEFFHNGLASSTRFVMEMAIRESGQVFETIASLVDVGGGTGMAARAVATAFPLIKCTVLELPHVIKGIPTDSPVEFVAGDMMDFIPPADALLLKVHVLHDWSDQDCVNILRRCKEAIPSREAGGKVIIIDIVVGSSSQAMCNETQLWLDLFMSMITTGMERKESKSGLGYSRKLGSVSIRLDPFWGFYQSLKSSHS